MKSIKEAIDGIHAGARTILTLGIVRWIQPDTDRFRVRGFPQEDRGPLIIS